MCEEKRCLSLVSCSSRPSLSARFQDVQGGGIERDYLFEQVMQMIGEDTQRAHDDAVARNIDLGMEPMDARIYVPSLTELRRDVFIQAAGGMNAAQSAAAQSFADRQAQSYRAWAFWHFRPPHWPGLTGGK